MPPDITKPIRLFASELGADRPRYVEVKPWTKASVLNCFLNVQERVKLVSGSIVHGWIIWEQPPLCLEAHFHAVWQKPEAKLIDITPPQDGEKRILFCRDPKRFWTGTKVPHRYYALDHNRRSVAVVSLMNKLRELECKYEETRTIPQSEMWSAVYSSGCTLEDAEILFQNTVVIPRHYKFQEGL
jgi:hypothetical protein